MLTVCLCSPGSPSSFSIMACAKLPGRRESITKSTLTRLILQSLAAAPAGVAVTGTAGADGCAADALRAEIIRLQAAQARNATGSCQAALPGSHRLHAKLQGLGTLLKQLCMTWCGPCLLACARTSLSNVMALDSSISLPAMQKDTS
jgi:hypothetical protein